MTELRGQSALIAWSWHTKCCKHMARPVSHANAGLSALVLCICCHVSHEGRRQYLALGVSPASVILRHW